MNLACIYVNPFSFAENGRFYIRTGAPFSRDSFKLLTYCAALYGLACFVCCCRDAYSLLSDLFLYALIFVKTFYECHNHNVA